MDRSEPSAKRNVERTFLSARPPSSHLRGFAPSREISLYGLNLLIEELGHLHVPLICTSQGIDTSNDNPVGRLQLGVLMAVAEFERSLIRERTKAGLAAARAKGVIIGRPRKAAKYQAVIQQLKKEGRSIRQIALQVGISTGSVHRMVKELPVQKSSPPTVALEPA